MNYLQEMEVLAHKMSELARMHGPSYQNEFSRTLLDLSSDEQAKDYIAQSHGYISWHWYVQSIKEAEQKSNYLKENSLVVDSECYRKAWQFVQTPQVCEIYQIIKSDNDNSENTCLFKTHQPVMLGSGWKNTRFLGLWKTRKKIYWKLDNFPLTLFGTSSSGKYYAAMTLAQKWIENREGVIVLSGTGNNIHHYDTLLNMAREQSRLDDVYVLKAYEDDICYKDKSIPLLEHTHSIDPLNPLIGNVWAFRQLFGTDLGMMIHALCNQVKNNSGLVDYQTIKTMLVWDNLNNWLVNNHWKEVTESIKLYLQGIRHDIHEHVKNTLKAFEILDTIEHYSQKGLFSIQPDINLEEIFTQRKILAILLSDEFDETASNKILKKLFSLYVHHAAKMKDKSNIQGNHWQNILMLEPQSLVREDEYVHTAFPEDFFSSLAKSSNWVFAGYSPYKNTWSEKGMVQAIKASNSILMMLTSSHRPEELPDELRLKILGKVIDKNQVLADELAYQSQCYQYGKRLIKTEKEVLDEIKENSFSSYNHHLSDLGELEGYLFTQGLGNGSNNKYVMSIIRKICAENDNEKKDYYLEKMRTDVYRQKDFIQFSYQNYHNKKIFSKNKIVIKKDIEKIR